jgi:hypothetical protein
MNSYRASNDWFLFGDGNAPWARHTTAGERKEYEALKMEVDALLKKRYKHTFEDIVFLNQNIQAKGKEGMAMERNSYFSRNPPVGRNLHPGRWLLA